MGDHVACGVALPDGPNPVVVVAGGAIRPDAAGLQAVAVVRVSRGATWATRRGHPVEDIPGKGLPSGRAGEVAIGVVGVVHPTGAGQAVVRIVGVVRGPARGGLDEPVAHRVILPGPRPVAGRIGGAGEAVEGIVAKGRRARAVDLGDTVPLLRCTSAGWCEVTARVKSLYK